MKIGDKLLCKKYGFLKSRMSYLRDDGHGTFEKGKYYEISYIHEGIFVKEYSEELAGKPFKMVRVRANYGVEIDFLVDISFKVKLFFFLNEYFHLIDDEINLDEK